MTRDENGVELKLAPQEDWRFEVACLDSVAPEVPTHVLAGMWEHPPGYLYWTKHVLEVRGAVNDSR